MIKRRSKEDTSYLGLYKAVRKYIHANGGSVVMATGIQIQEWPGARPHEFIVGVKCVGRRPTFAELEVSA